MEADRKRLDAEHDDMMRRWGSFPTPRAQAKAAKEIAELEARMDELDKQRENLGQVVAAHYRESNELSLAIVQAQQAMRGQDTERALRQRAEALRAVVRRIDCTFKATGQKGGGWGIKNSNLTSVTIYPIVGEPAAFSADSKGTLLYSSAHSCMYRTCVGRMR